MSQAGSITPGGGGGSSGALVLIQTQTVSGVTEVDFTSGITTTYDNYYIIGRNISLTIPFGGGLVCQISDDGGVTYISTGYHDGLDGLSVLANGSGTQIGSFTITFVCLTDGIGVIQNLGAFNIPGNGGVANDTYENGPIIVNALRFIMTDSSSFSGTFSLYGITQ
jgi:hypothetical protein